MQRIIYEQDDGTVAIVIPSPRWKGTLEELASQVVPQGVSWEVVPTDTIPSDRTFRNAWKRDLTVDMPKAREIVKAKLRVDRAPLLAALDVEYMRALEQGDKATEADVVARKQALRDATDDPAIVDAKTPEDLKAIALPAVVTATIKK